MYKKLDFNQQDLLTEIGTIGTGNAATAMADLIGKKITITVPKVDLVGFDHVSDFVGGAEHVLACVYLGVEGDLPGTVLVMFDSDTASRLLSSLVPDPVEGFFNLSELQQSALKEIGNILSGSYLSALADFSGQKMVSTVPNLAIDMAEAVLSVPMIKLGNLADCALMIQATFFEEKCNSGYILFIPDPQAADKLLDLFGVNQDG